MHAITTKVKLFEASVFRALPNTQMKIEVITSDADTITMKMNPADIRLDLQYLCDMVNRQVPNSCSLTEEMPDCITVKINTNNN